MRGGAWSSGIAVEGRAAEPGRSFGAMWNRVSAHYFETIGTPVVRGRAIDESDTPASRRVALVNRAFAERYFPGQDPLGRHFRFSAGHDPAYEIVGVVENAIYANPREPAGPMFFLPYLQMTPAEWKDSARARSNFVQDIELRIDPAAQGLEAQVRRALQEVDANLSVIRMVSLREQMSGQFTRERLLARLTEVFGAVALALACLGLYGVMAYVVAQRTAEIGVRTALGASRGSIAAMVLRGALWQIGCGLAVGIPAAQAAARVLEGQIFGVNTGDPVTLTGAALLLVGCALGAALLPANRAARVDPMQALRAE